MGWPHVAAARREFADTIAGLTPDQLDGESLCEGWSPHVVTAHLVSFVDVSLPRFALNLVRHRGRIGQAEDALARKLATRPIEDLLATMRGHADKEWSLPTFPEALTLADLVIHHQDVRRGLGLDTASSHEHVRMSLDFLTTHKRAAVLLETKGLLDGLRFHATDLDWSWGEGELISGPGESILMAVTRRDTFDELGGAGVPKLKARIAAI